MRDIIDFGDANAFYIIFFIVYIFAFIALISILVDKFFSKEYDIKKAYELLKKAHKQETLDSDAIFLVYKQQIEKKYDITYIDFLEKFLLRTSRR